MIDLYVLSDIGLKSAAIATIALAAAHLLRHRSAAERSAVLHSGLLALALLPLLAALAPRWQLELPLPVAIDSIPAASSATPPPAEAHAAGRDPAAAAATTAVAGFRAAPATPVAVSTAPISQSTLLGLLYSVPVLALWFALCMSLTALGALRDRAVAVRDPHWRNSLLSAQRRSGVDGHVELLHVAGLPSPLSWGMRRRVIVLDVTACAPDDADVLLAHELAHLARHDWEKLLFARIVTALFWFNPLVWVLARRCHQLREEAADDAVLRGAVAGLEYAELLLGFARRAAGRPQFAAHAIFAGGGARPHLSRRLARVLDERERRSPAPRAWSLACGVAALACALPIAALTPALVPLTRNIAATAHVQPRPKPAPTASPASRAAPELAPVAATTPAPRALPALAAASATAANGRPGALRFTLAPRRGDTGDLLQLTFEETLEGGEMRHGTDVARATLQGLASTAFGASSMQPVTFRLVREAGTFVCEGEAQHGRASGTCRFDAEPRFAAELARRGVGRITPQEQRLLALQGARLALLDELARQGYETPDVARYIELSIHGADAEWLRGLEDAGIERVGLVRLVEFRIHGVTPRFVRELADAGLRDLPAARLVEFRIHGVTPEFVTGLAARGYRDLAPSRLVEFRIHGVTPEFVAELAARGYRDLPPERLVEFRIHGVSPRFVRELADAGLRDLPAARLVEFRIHGVTPEFVTGLAALGYRDLSPSRLVEFRIHDVTPEFVAELAARGYRDLPPERLVEFRIHGVSPRFVSELQALGYTTVPADELVTMRIHSVTPAWIRVQLADAPPRPEIAELVSRRIHGR
jgi:bla regulator protein BlaR1